MQHRAERIRQALAERAEEDDMAIGMKDVERLAEAAEHPVLVGALKWLPPGSGQRLTAVHLEIMLGVANGLDVPEIARRMYLRHDTVRIRAREVMAALHANSHAHAVALLLRKLPEWRALVDAGWEDAPAIPAPEDGVPQGDVRQAASAAPAGPFFEPGHTYLSANGWFRFTCERVVDGIAIGKEEELHPEWNPPSRRAWHGRGWHGVMAEDCWTKVELTETASAVARAGEAS